MRHKPIRQYTACIHGEEVTVSVFRPATKEDMKKQPYVDSEFESPTNGDKYPVVKDTYETLCADAELWELVEQEAKDAEET